MKSPKIRFKEFNSKWDLTTLGEVCSFSKGKGYSKNDLIKNGNPIILYGSLYTNYKTIIDKIDTFAKLKENSILSFGDEVVIPSSGETAEDISVASAVKIKNAIVGGDLNILKPKINSIFLAYKLSNGNTKKEISKKAQGKSVVHLYNNDLKDIAIVIPTDLKEQEAIGEFFRKIDEILDLEKLRFKKFENFKKTMLDKLFVASGENAPRLRLGSFTSAWTSVNLGELGEIIKGQQINKIDLLPSGKYYVLNGGITPSGYTNSFNTNENIISISEGGNSCGFVNFNKEKFWSGGHNYTLQNLVINTRFLYALLKYREKNIMSLRVGSGLPNIQKSSLLEFKIQIPTDLKEQEAIGEFFKKIDEILELSQNRISKLENIKKYLLNKMFV
ncbi:restriction endonuclease subunit S [Campylobacter hyointestinalis]|uniref:restriction endonuclease subunit S n=1 Tax=Campylobacter hyointestinalis TaxID=198 RepID=UPI001BD54CA5|nr:restriction endonuclease subunit S [Campylobacter hyointestinalis]MBT0611369.1 restriction endonuclease subunit S [Campylobacter hyointestinalis subsp. hyointestinalis]